MNFASSVVPSLYSRFSVASHTRKTTRRLRTRNACMQAEEAERENGIKVAELSILGVLVQIARYG